MRDDMMKYVTGTNSVTKHNVNRLLESNAHIIALNAEAKKESKERRDFPRFINTF